MDKNVKEKLKGFLKELRVYRKTFAILPVYKDEKNDKFDPLYKHVISTQNNIDKNFSKEELGYFIVDIVSDKLQNKFGKSSEDEKYEGVTILLNEQEINEIINNIEKEIIKLPFEYKIYFNLGISDKIFQDISIQIDSDLFIKGIDRSALPEEGFNSIKPLNEFYLSQIKNEIRKGDSLTVELTIKGYIQKYIMTPILEQSIKKIKMFIALTVIFNIFQIDFYKYLTFYYQKSLFVYDKNQKYIRTVEFEHDISEALHRLILHDFNLESNMLILLSNNPSQSKIEIFQNNFVSIKKYFSFINKPDKSKVDLKYANRLENILTWFLIGISSLNKTIGFISLVFAFESLFIISEKDTSESISTRLAGRCAYFISDNFKERNEIIENIKKIYKLRSDIVHEGKQILKDELDLFSKLLSLLQSSLKKEISNIKI